VIGKNSYLNLLTYLLDLE